VVQEAGIERDHGALCAKGPRKQEVCTVCTGLTLATEALFNTPPVRAQKRAADKQAEVDELRARRYQETKDREWRAKEKATAERQANMQVCMPVYVCMCMRDACGNGAGRCTPLHAPHCMQTPLHANHAPHCPHPSTSQAELADAREAQKAAKMLQRAEMARVRAARGARRVHTCVHPAHVCMVAPALSRRCCLTDWA